MISIGGGVSKVFDEENSPSHEAVASG